VGGGLLEEFGDGDAFVEADLEGREYSPKQSRDREGAVGCPICYRAESRLLTRAALIFGMGPEQPLADARGSD
jgi:hypothetical protein